ncbi:hypothetical protein J7I98_13245 [Streptomyces sp. ISL-98]|uniref:coiled-coil domain-containing protein n=1 Tax=Streptomyces sp. ISL-98 TaxID=2819192 RepID=UPI001BE7E440|nr:hypothetical protein [Streptomyces sp. ISL-98]MBT2506838.1 hypothetical protein [Streptomyces sp. ISL-98]
MPRGRHRHSPPLHRILPPSAVAGASIISAAGAWLFAEPVVLRGLVAVAAAAAVTGAVMMRSWDRSAGRRVAELTRARASDEWKTEERIADLESDLDESRALRARLDAKLRAKRVELAALRGEHAALLRRYATAETERASALEGRRLLAIEAASPAKALPAASSTPTPSAYLRATMALDNLSRNAAKQAREPRGPGGVEQPEGKHEAAAGTDAVSGSESSPEHARPSSAIATRPVASASAVVPYDAAQNRRASRTEGGFDFFGTQKPGPAAIEAVEKEDLADVVGEEALAAASRASGARVVGQVIDLTAHDETEQLSVAELRSAIS